MKTTLEVDRIAASIPSRAAIVAGGLGDPGEALDLVRDLHKVLESDYRLALVTDRRAAGKFVGKVIASKFSTSCKVCGKAIAVGAECIWSKGEGCACTACGEPEGVRR